MPLNFGDWLTAQGPEYYRMVEAMLEHNVTCQDVIDWIKSTHGGDS